MKNAVDYPWQGNLVSIVGTSLISLQRRGRARQKIFKPLSKRYMENILDFSEGIA